MRNLMEAVEVKSNSSIKSKDSTQEVVKVK
jgi:hypothetical protein